MFGIIFFMKKKVVLTYGTFDLFHYGHDNIVMKAKEAGDYLIVGLSTDKFNTSKGKKAFDDFETRKNNLLKTGLVDLVIPESHWEQKIKDIKHYKVDLFVMGSDWEGKFDELNVHCMVKYFPRTKGISSTQLREEISKNKK